MPDLRSVLEIHACVAYWQGFSNLRGFRHPFENPSCNYWQCQKCRVSSLNLRRNIIISWASFLLSSTPNWLEIEKGLLDPAFWVVIFGIPLISALHIPSGMDSVVFFDYLKHLFLIKRYLRTVTQLRNTRAHSACYRQETYIISESCTLLEKFYFARISSFPIDHICFQWCFTLGRI